MSSLILILHCVTNGLIMNLYRADTSEVTNSVCLIQVSQGSYSLKLLKFHDLSEFSMA